MNIRAVYTLFRKEVHRFREVIGQTVFAPVVSNLLFLAIFGAALAERGRFFEGFGYLEAMLPGLVAMGLMMNAFQNSSSSLVIGKYTNNIVELLMLPMRGFEIMLAYVGGALVRGVLVAGVTLAVGSLFTTLHFAHPLWIIYFTLMLGGMFASFGGIVGIWAEGFDQSSNVYNFALTPLIFLGGVFFPISRLPEAFAGLSHMNPMFYLIDGFRYAFIGTGDLPVAVSAGVTFALFALAFGLASWMFESGYKLKT